MRSRALVSSTRSRIYARKKIEMHTQLSDGSLSLDLGALEELSLPELQSASGGPKRCGFHPDVGNAVIRGASGGVHVYVGHGVVLCGVHMHVAGGRGGGEVVVSNSDVFVDGW